ncbi:MAG TPA: cyclohexanecarboxylate-CoA ligase, partial [Acidobacteria bacterium]|nr:cyclohexanecarboxylate-CoA ligase [Acidobacteriota bacterium]
MRQPDSLTEDGVKQFRQQGYWQGRLFVDLIDSHATVAPDKIAIIEASTQTRLSYQQLRDQTKNLAASLVRLGIGKSDVVSIQAPNWPELVICHLALNR